jgi:hypothetical protein
MATNPLLGLRMTTASSVRDARLLDQMSSALSSQAVDDLQTAASSRSRYLGSHTSASSTNARAAEDSGHPDLSWMNDTLSELTNSGGGADMLDAMGFAVSTFQS